MAVHRRSNSILILVEVLLLVKVFSFSVILVAVHRSQFSALAVCATSTSILVVRDTSGSATSILLVVGHTGGVATTSNSILVLRHTISSAAQSILVHCSI